MKLRIRGNSIRLRVTRTEAAAIGAGQSVREDTEFGPENRLSYWLTSDREAQEVKASLQGGEIRVTLPSHIAQAWANTNQVSIRSEQMVGGDQGLKILVEKDFACLAPRPDEDESDMFDHPNADG